MTSKFAWTRAIIGFIGILLLTIGSSFFYLPDEHTGIDFLHFWVIPQVVREMPDVSIYDQADHPRIFEQVKIIANNSELPHLQNLIEKNEALYSDGIHPTGSPFLYASFGLTQTGSFEFDFWAYQLISTFLLLSGILAWGQVTGTSLGKSFVIAILTLLIYASVVVDFGVANTNRFQVGVVILIFSALVWSNSNNLRSRPVVICLCGLLFGLLIVFKPNVVLAPVFLLMVLLIDRQTKPAALLGLGLAIGAAMAILIGCFFFGDLNCWSEWRAYVNEMIRESFPMNSGNCTFLALAPSNILPQLSLFITGLLGVIMLGASWFTRVKPSDKGELDNNFFAIRYLPIACSGLLVPLLSSPVAWSHYFLLALPAILVLTPGFRNIDKSNLKAILFACTWIIGTLLVSGLFITLFRIADPILITLQLSLGIVILFMSVIASLFAMPVRTETRQESTSN